MVLTATSDNDSVAGEDGTGGSSTRGSGVSDSGGDGDNNRTLWLLLDLLGILNPTDLPVVGSAPGVMVVATGMGGAAATDVLLLSSSDSFSYTFSMIFLAVL